MKKNDPKGATTASPSAAQIIRELDSATIEVGGEQISTREGEIRLLYVKALKGNVAASKELQRIRDRTGAEAPPRRYGVLVVPAPLGLEEFTKMAYEQQRQFRENPNGPADFKGQAASPSSLSIRRRTVAANRSRRWRSSSCGSYGLAVRQRRCSMTASSTPRRDPAREWRH